MPLTSASSLDGDTGQTDTSSSIIANAIKVAKLAAAGYLLYCKYDIFKAEWDIAKKYYNIAKWWLDYYKDNYAPVENTEVKEALALEKTTPDYETARGRSRVAAWLAFKGKTLDIYKKTTRYSTGVRAFYLTNIMTAQGDAVAQADGLGYRNERAYVKTRNDIRFQKMMSTAKRGRNMAADPVSFTKDALGSYGDVWKQVGGNLNKLGKSMGYSEARNETEYPHFASTTAVAVGSRSAVTTVGAERKGGDA